MNACSYYHVFSRDMVDYFNNNITRLGQAQDFLESFNWTDDARRDLEAVNVNGNHTVTCGLLVKTSDKIKFQIAIARCLAI